MNERPGCETSAHEAAESALALRAAALALPAGAFDEARARARSLRGKVVVVKYGGAIMGDRGLSVSWADDVALLQQSGVRLVIVHGGGPALTRTLARMGIESAFVDGHRVTTGESAEVAEMVLSGRINKEVVSLLCRVGARAIGLSGTDGGILRVRPLRPGGRDIGFVGEVAAVETAPLRLLLEGGYIPVLSSTASDDCGQPYNINADLVAGAVAGALGASSLIVLSDVPGLAVNGRTVARIGETSARALLADGAEITGGMRPKLEGALLALAAGVPSVHLVDGRARNALLRELLFAPGSGTLIVPDDAAEPRGAGARSVCEPDGSSASAVRAMAAASAAAAESPGAQHLGGPAVVSASATSATEGAKAAAAESPGARRLSGPAGASASASSAMAGASAAATTLGPSAASPFEPPPWAGTLARRGAEAVMGTYARYPLELVQGRGCRVVDGAGRTYLDFVAGIAVNVLGHGHPAIVEAMRAASGGMLHASNLYWTEPMVRLAERLTRAAGMERAFFCNSGAEAVEAAIKMARKARPGRERIVVFERSFHGRTMGALSATMQAGYQDPFRPLLPGIVALPFGDFGAAAAAIDEHTAAVLLEPIQGEGGVRPAPPGFLLHLRARCDAAGALLLLDEVQTGLGRTGTLFAYEGEGIRPDAVVCAKALAGGLPMGALLARGQAAGALAVGDHGSTFGGGPFVATVAHAVLDTILAPGFLDTVTGNGRRLEAALRVLATAHPGLVAGIRGRGLMQGIALREPCAPELVGELHALGLLAVPAGKDVLRLLPPLTVTSSEIDEGAAMIAEGLARLSAAVAPKRVAVAASKREAASDAAGSGAASMHASPTAASAPQASATHASATDPAGRGAAAVDLAAGDIRAGKNRRPGPSRPTIPGPREV